MTACRECGIRNLVFTSSPSVVHDGKDLVGVSEEYPYPEHFDSFYAETKALAEREVLSAPAHSNLRTVALRPHLIWGPHDTNLIPTILERAAAGRLTRIGDGDNKVDLTFIEDCVEAHLLAMRAIEQGDDKVIGRAYFISQGDPVNMWDWIDSVLIAHDLPPVKRAVSKAAALRIATVLEGVSRLLLTLGVNFKPLLTRFLVSEMSTHHYFSIEAAKRDLGYQPSCSIADAMKKTFGSIA